MQRKNGILRTSHKNGFAMIMAISVIVIIATIMALSMSLTTQTTKRTNDLYLYEQATLLAKSATEYALLKISENGCINNLNFTQDIYDVNISMRYIYTAPSGCNDYFTISTPESNGTVLMDVAISVTDKNISPEPIRYFRRTIQKL